MNRTEIKIITYPALPCADITPLERLVLSYVLDCAETDEGLELYTDTGPRNPVIVARRELIAALHASGGARECLLKGYIEDRVLAHLPHDDVEPETPVLIDLSSFPWQFIVQDILTRSATAREFVVIQWINDSSQRPDTFGASVSLITRNGFSHATSADLLTEFRRRDEAMTSAGARDLASAEPADDPPPES